MQDFKIKGEGRCREGLGRVVSWFLIQYQMNLKLKET